MSVDALYQSGDPDFMTSLARGLAVMRVVAEAERPMTVAEVSRRTALSRAAVRRCLYTLMKLGYVGQNERGFSIRRQALALGHAFVSLNSLAARSQALLNQLRDELGESCSLGIIEEDQLYYVARAEASRIMSIRLRVGSCLPLYATSMGRVLLAGRSRHEQEAYLDRVNLRPLTPRTVTDPAQLLSIIWTIKNSGYAIVDQELEVGLRSIAVPIRDGGDVVAALNVGTAAARITSDELRGPILTAMQQVAAKLSC